MSAGPTAVAGLVHTLHLHPRVGYQGLYSDPATRVRLLANLPDLLPFRGSYHRVLVIVDWDHHLPSRQLTARIYLYYGADRLAHGEQAFAERLEDIGRRDKYPEFDVPDFGDLPADEIYEASVESDGTVRGCRLTSSWRREVAVADGHIAVTVARDSSEFNQIVAAAVQRPRHLGDLEAVSWTPPCESGHPAWTLDVWYLLAFDGRVGTGRSLLVDVAARQVIKVRDFTVRAG